MFAIRAMMEMMREEMRIRLLESLLLRLNVAIKVMMLRTNPHKAPQEKKHKRNEMHENAKTHMFFFFDNCSSIIMPPQPIINKNE